MRRRPAHDPRHLRSRIHRAILARRLGYDQLGAMGATSVINSPAIITGHSRIRIGEHVNVRPGAFIGMVEEHFGRHYEPSLTIGSNIHIGWTFVCSCAGSVTIEDDVLIGNNVYIGDTYHGYRDPDTPIAYQPVAEPRQVRIGRGSFISHGAAISRASVGENSFVGANAVVTRDVPDRCLVVGNPARIVRRWDGERWVDTGD
jgi:acetyltransferase-like isoleucine patch superfamily enzyme